MQYVCKYMHILFIVVRVEPIFYLNDMQIKGSLSLLLLSLN